MRNHLEDVAKYDVALCPLNVIMCTTSRYLVLPSNLGFRTSSLFIEIQIRRMITKWIVNTKSNVGNINMDILNLNIINGIIF